MCIGPYICAEWHGGGLPYWLLQRTAHDSHDIDVRSNDVAYVRAVRRWFSVLMPRLRAQLFHNGGPIVMMQLENEFGNHASDAGAHMLTLRNIVAHEHKIDCLLFTADGAHVESQQAGGVDGVLRTLTLRKSPTNAFRLRRTVY